MSRWTTVAVPLVAGALLCCAAPTPTRLLIGMDTDLEAGDSIEELRIEVGDGSGSPSPVALLPRAGEALEFPVSFVVEEDLLGRGGPVEIYVRLRALTTSGELTNNRVIERRVRTAFVPGETRVVRLLLERACGGFSNVCSVRGDGSTCVHRRCVSPDISASELAPGEPGDELVGFEALRDAQALAIEQETSGWGDEPIALNEWYSDARADYLTTSDPFWAAGEPGEVRGDYRFVRTIGRILPPSPSPPQVGTGGLTRWYSEGSTEFQSMTLPVWQPGFDDDDDDWQSRPWPERIRDDQRSTEVYAPRLEGYVFWGDGTCAPPRPGLVPLIALFRRNPPSSHDNWLTTGPPCSGTPREWEQFYVHVRVSGWLYPP